MTSHDICSSFSRQNLHPESSFAHHDDDSAQIDSGTPAPRMSPDLRGRVTVEGVPVHTYHFKRSGTLDDFTPLEQ